MFKTLKAQSILDASKGRLWCKHSWQALANSIRFCSLVTDNLRWRFRSLCNDSISFRWISTCLSPISASYFEHFPGFLSNLENSSGSLSNILIFCVQALDFYSAILYKVYQLNICVSLPPTNMTVMDIIISPNKPRKLTI